MLVIVLQIVIKCTEMNIINITNINLCNEDEVMNFFKNMIQINYRAQRADRTRSELQSLESAG